MYLTLPWKRPGIYSRTDGIGCVCDVELRCVKWPIAMHLHCCANHDLCDCENVHRTGDGWIAIEIIGLGCTFFLSRYLGDSSECFFHREFVHVRCLLVYYKLTTGTFRYTHAYTRDSTRHPCGVPSLQSPNGTWNYTLQEHSNTRHIIEFSSYTST